MTEDICLALGIDSEGKVRGVVMEAGDAINEYNSKSLWDLGVDGKGVPMGEDTSPLAQRRPRKTGEKNGSDSSSWIINSLNPA